MGGNVYFGDMHEHFYSESVVLVAIFNMFPIIQGHSFLRMTSDLQKCCATVLLDLNDSAVA